MRARTSLVHTTRQVASSSPSPPKPRHHLSLGRRIAETLETGRQVRDSKIQVSSLQCLGRAVLQEHDQPTSQVRRNGTAMTGGSQLRWKKSRHPRTIKKAVACQGCRMICGRKRKLSDAVPGGIRVDPEKQVCSGADADRYLVFWWAGERRVDYVNVPGLQRTP